MEPAAPAPAERFAGIIAGLRHAIAAAAAKNAPARPLLLLLWSRLHRFVVRFAALSARVAAGTAAPRRRPASPRPAAERSRKPYQRLPRRFAWLPPLVPGEAAAYGSQLQHLLAEPEMAALIAAAPQAGRVLRPLCRMLGVRLPPALLPPPPAPPPARPVAPSRPRPAAPGPAPLPSRHACGPPVPA